VEALLWAFQTHDGFTLAWPFFLSLGVGFLLVQSDFLWLLLAFFSRAAIRGRSDSFVSGASGPVSSGLVIIPALLRNADDLKAITTSVESCAANGYPGELVVIASVDGRTEKPALYRQLCTWVARLSLPANVFVYVGGTETRLGKMMAVEAGVRRMKELVASGQHRFPELYFSLDGDGTLGPHSLERLALRLKKPHPLTGNLRRVVSGKICIRPDLFWRGWRNLLPHYFSISGQIYMQVAREFLLSNVARFNWKPAPQIGIPGALYCTWSRILLEAPRFMGFMKTITVRQWLRWWLGHEPPRFSTSRATPCPEALTGASDDTCIAFIASIASWQGGVLSFDAPRTPLHAFGRMLRGYLFERSHDYEPEARVYTYTPSTLRGLWKQRVRWNSSRFECAGRFWRAFFFHWEIGFPTLSHLWMVIKHVLELTLYYLLLPYFVLGGTSVGVGYVVGYLAQVVAYSIYTGFALVLEKERKRFWVVALCLPFAPLYVLAINFFGCVYGVVKDLALFGNETNFAPEWTLRKGATERIAILFRIRRFFALCLRAVVVGDVPFGWFWLGWGETAWTPSGYDGWTTGKKPRPILPPALWRATLRRWISGGGTSSAPRAGAARSEGPAA
jgi:hypothetical protein